MMVYMRVGRPRTEGPRAAAVEAAAVEQGLSKPTRGCAVMRKRRRWQLLPPRRALLLRCRSLLRLAAQGVPRPSNGCA